MKISEAISKLRQKLGQHGYDDDSIFTDEYLYQLLNDAGAIIVSRITKKFNKLPNWLFTRFPVPLTLVNADLFECEEFDRCKVLESTFVIPETISGRNRILFKVYSNNTELSEYTAGSEYNEILSQTPSWKLVNGKLRIYGNKDLVGVEVEGVWADIIDWQDKKYCGNTEIECYDLDELDYPLYSNREYTLMAHELIFKELQIPLKEPLENQPN